MSIRTQVVIALFLVVVGGCVFVLRESIDTRIPERVSLSAGDAAPYAEISTIPAQAFPSATSTEKFKLPILVYHIVRPSRPSDSAAVRALAHTPEIFDAEMNYLRTAEYHIVRFSDLEAYVKSGTPLPSKPVILSFDDGWYDQFKYALPILEKYQYAATFFIFTNSIGRKGFLNWGELKQLLAAGMDIGDHSRSHPYLTKAANETVLWNEIYGSKQILEKHLGVTINEFAYPFGQYNPAIVALVEKARYKSARGDYYSGEQSASRLLELSAMNAPTTTALFVQKFP